MKLHEDERALEEAIRATALHLSLPITYVEKDYWVTRALKELALSNVSEKIVFKGGTSLSFVKQGLWSDCSVFRRY